MLFLSPGCEDLGSAFAPSLMPTPPLAPIIALVCVAAGWQEAGDKSAVKVAYDLAASLAI